MSASRYSTIVPLLQEDVELLVRGRGVAGDQLVTVDPIGRACDVYGSPIGAMAFHPEDALAFANALSVAAETLLADAEAAECAGQLQARKRPRSAARVSEQDSI